MEFKKSERQKKIVTKELISTGIKGDLKNE